MTRPRGWWTWIPAFAGMTSSAGKTSGVEKTNRERIVIPAKAGIHRERIVIPAKAGIQIGRLVALLGMLALLAAPADAQPDTARVRGTAAMRAGRYDEGIALLRAAAERPDATTDARALYLRALGETGKDDEAETAARRYVESAAAPWTALGELLARTGRPADARAAFERAITARSADSLTARADLALLLRDSGDRDGARAQLRRIVASADAPALTADQWLAIGVAQRELGREEPARGRQAIRAFDAAAVAAPGDPEPRVRAGELFLDAFNAAEARRSFEAVLRTNPRHPRALLGLARVLQFDGAAGGAALAESSLVTNPRLAAARLFLAASRLDVEDYAGADSLVTCVLTVDSVSLDALTLRGALRYIQGDSAGMETARRRVLARDAQHADFYATLAELSARHRRYGDAARLAAAGVALDRTSWHSHALRGMNQLRLGFPDSARSSLEAAFAGNPYDVWVKNTLDLLDATRAYRTERTAHFALVADSTESTLLSLYLGDLLEDGYAKLAARYGYQPPGPVRLELYRSHADFSVRTVGLAGLGALGVSFGPVLAMDSPAAREVGAFGWGSTAWHELAHTFTLGMTNDRVPRWLSEGLSVLEERRARPGWGDGPTPAWLAAFRAGQIPPLTRFDDGFIHPAFPEQVLFSYYAASLVGEMIERDWGVAGIRSLLGAYRDGLDTPAAVQRALHVDLQTLDTRFQAFVRQRFGAALEAAGAPDGAFAHAMEASDSLVQAGDTTKAIAALERAKALFPDYAGEDSPYERLATVYKARNDPKRAADELMQLSAHDASHYPALLALAELREQLHDAAGAADALERAIWVSPYDPAIHTRLAALAEQIGDRKRVVRERRAVLALAPVDIADARYELARALLAAGDAAGAKREVLRALERAPGYVPAQELLLRLVDGRPAGGLDR